MRSQTDAGGAFFSAGIFSDKDFSVGLLQTVAGFFKREQTDFASHFKQRSMPAGVPEVGIFPTKKFIGTGGLYAWRLRFQVAEADAARVVLVLAAGFPQAKASVVQFGLLTNAAGASVNITSTREFGGVVIELITNSLPLMAALDQLQLAPVPPWIAFPKLNPAEYGSLKEPFDYWWSQLWLPFWSTLDAGQRGAYLAARQAAPEWATFCAWHTPHGQ